MNEKKINMKKPEDINSSVISAENSAVNSNKDSFVIPYEAACSPEFAEGCIVMEDEADKVFDKEG